MPRSIGDASDADVTTRACRLFLMIASNEDNFFHSGKYENTSTDGRLQSKML